MSEIFNPISRAFFWGSISAISLPLGALIGLLVKPGRKVTSALMAFGGGALLFALTIELFSEALHYGREYGNQIVVSTIVGALIGGILFDLLNQLLNNRGAFLRKFVTTRKHLMGIKKIIARRLINELSRVKLLQSLPPEDIAKLIPDMKRETFDPGEVVFREDDMGSTLYFIVSGQVVILKKNRLGHDKKIAVLTDFDTFGEMALLSHRPRNATAKCITQTIVLKALHSDFNDLLAESDDLRESVLVLFNQRAEDLSQKSEGYQAAMGTGAAMAIWLGILLDGIPESLIIGIFSKSITGISLAFIIGVFLANLPEAMSSAVGMQKSGMRFWRIFWMWGSLCIITGIGAAIGSVIFPASPTGSELFWIAGIEGVAAGAMLTMIAETMLPEAFEQGGAIVGFATLLGFITALIVKII